MAKLYTQIGQELLYLWIDEFRGFKNENINFSPNWRFHYAPKDEKITVEQNDNLPQNFFGDNVCNVSAIVGANGAGKSTLIEYLLRFGLSEYYYGSTTIIAIWKIDKRVDDNIKNKSSIETKYYISHNEKVPIQGIKYINTTQEFILDEFNFKEILSEEDNQNAFNSLKYTNNNKQFFYSNLLDLNKDNNNQFRGNNLSTSNLMNGGESYLYYDNQNDKPLFSRGSDIPVHLTLDLLRQIKLILSGFDLPFQQPEEIWIHPSFHHIRIIENEINKQGVSKELFQNIQVIYNGIEFHLEDKLIGYYWLSIFSYILEKEDFSKFHFENKDSKTLSLDIKSLAHQIKENTKNQSGDDGILFPIQQFIDKYKQSHNLDFLDDLYSFLSELSYQLINHRISIGNWILATNDTSQHWEELKSLLKKSPPHLLDIMNFSWRTMSSGETAFLTLFARFHDQKEIINSGNAMIFIDEGEQGFHPQWQKKYLSTLLNFFNNKDIFNGNIQLFLTTHSPFLVSDLPKENIIFLDKEVNKDHSVSFKVVSGLNKEGTFGANIHTLFSDSFFIRGGIVGEFARKKIDATFKTLIQLKSAGHSDIREEKKIEIRQIISKVGDVLVARKLVSLYDEVFREETENEFIDKQIKYWESLKKKRKQ